MNLEQHGVEGRLLSYEFALHIVDPGTRAHHHAAAEKDLPNEDRDQNIGVLFKFRLFFLLCLLIL